MQRTSSHDYLSVWHSLHNNKEGKTASLKSHIALAIQKKAQGRKIQNNDPRMHHQTGSRVAKFKCLLITIANLSKQITHCHYSQENKVTHHGKTKSATVRPFHGECLKNQYWPPP
jgi:hypothetical protein